MRLSVWNDNARQRGTLERHISNVRHAVRYRNAFQRSAAIERTTNTRYAVGNCNAR